MAGTGRAGPDWEWTAGAAARELDLPDSSYGYRTSLAVHPEGGLVIAASRLWRLRRQSSALAVVANGYEVPLRDRGVVYAFDPRGLPTHVRLEPLGLTALRFHHDNAGALTSLVDADDNTLRIERPDAEHVVLTAPFGEVTHLWDDDDDGFADRIEYEDDPAGAGFALHYGTGPQEGLLLSMVDRTGVEHRYAYDEDGRLTEDTLVGIGTQKLSPDPVVHDMPSTAASA